MRRHVRFGTQALRQTARGRDLRQRPVNPAIRRGPLWAWKALRARPSTLHGLPADRLLDGALAPLLCRAFGGSAIREPVRGNVLFYASGLRRRPQTAPQAPA